MHSTRLSIIAFVLMACSDDLPPCHPEGSAGPVWSPTPSPLPGPGGPGYPPDHADPQEKYSRNEDGQVCVCGAYQMDCTTDPDGIPGDPTGVSSNPGECGTGCGGTSTADQQTILEQMLNNGHEAGGIICATPSDCVKKCVSEKKWCWAEKAGHPYKADQIGNLIDCIDSFPAAKYGGSYTCLYRFDNGDVCIFAYAAHLGPITSPAPPPLCVYKSP